MSNTSGARLETYTIAGAPGGGAICMNGAAAHLISEGEQVLQRRIARDSRVMTSTSPSRR